MTIDKEAVGWIIAGLGVLVAVLTWLRTRRQDHYADAGADAGVRLDLEYIKRGVDDIRVDQQRMREDMGRMAERVARVEGRLDDHINMHPPD
jgi:hypothetical protein